MNPFYQENLLRLVGNELFLRINTSMKTRPLIKLKSQPEKIYENISQKLK